MRLVLTEEQILILLEFLNDEDSKLSQTPQSDYFEGKNLQSRHRDVVAIRNQILFQY